MTLITRGAWRATPLRPTSATWPFDWQAEITAIDPVCRRHQYVGRLVQAGGRPIGEAQANLSAVGLVPEMVRLLKAVAGVIAMSDPEDDTFVDSAADCLAALLDHGGAIALVLAQLGEETGRKGPDE